MEMDGSVPTAWSQLRWIWLEVRVSVWVRMGGEGSICVRACGSRCERSYGVGVYDE